MPQLWFRLPVRDAPPPAHAEGVKILWLVLGAWITACDLPGPKVTDPFAPIPPLPALPLLDRTPPPPLTAGAVLFNPLTSRAVTGVAHLPVGQYDVEGVLVDGKLTALLKQNTRPVGTLTGTLTGGSWQIPPHQGDWHRQAPGPSQ